CRQDHLRCKTFRPSGHAADQVRACDQSQGRQDARPRPSGQAARARRRGDRMIGRRQFITLVVGAAAAWPLTVRAQQPERMRRIALLMTLAADDPEAQARNAAFLQALGELGWTVGRNVQIDYRWSGADADRIRKAVAELIALAPDLIQANS